MLKRYLMTGLLVCCFTAAGTAMADQQVSAAPVAATSGFASQEDAPQKNHGAFDFISKKTSEFSEKTSELLIHAMGLIGVPYKYGGSNPESGMDCSGFVSYVFRQALGVPLPHNAYAIALQGNNINVNELQPGDLVFFNTMRRTFSHVGIYMGNNQFIHAPSSRSSGIQISNLRDRYWADRFNGARRLPATQEQK